MLSHIKKEMKHIIHALQKKKVMGHNKGKEIYDDDNWQVSKGSDN